MDGRMERGRGGDVGGRDVGGQRLKLRHKSHPERKHEVNPPPFPCTSLPLRPGPLLSPPLRLPPFPLLRCTESAPWMDQVYFILLLHVLQTAHFLLAFHLPLLPFSYPRIPACYKAINHTADPIGKRGKKNGGGLRLKKHETEK